MSDPIERPSNPFYEIERTRAADAMARSDAECMEHGRIEGEKLATGWERDWKLIVTETMRLTGLSLSDTLAYMTFLQCHAARLHAVNYYDWCYRMYHKAWEKDYGDPPPDASTR